MVSIRTCLLIILATVLLAGCFYPQERRVENQAPYQAQLEAVQSAVIQYRLDNGVLPTAPREEGTPLFRRYPVNFARLVPQYLESAPGNSFENGGIYQYVITNPEEMAEVKLIDLTVIREIQEFERRLQMYRRENEYAPVAGVAGEEILEIDYEALNYEEQPAVDSPFHPTHRLPLLMQTNGDIIIDYSLDIQYYLENEDASSYGEGDDLRYLLVENSPFVPVNSRGQTIENGEIVFLPAEIE
ncbi:hypothetical protein MM300_17200 [Evansella sp. LMS18]|jgi:hypothetical protein|uniref:hypothetical protein n=1 Tax=Evansella sp. LMS18 TaxID=2924033 RepID=UPI0020D04CE5|nr:hypothetical protein [Evansella sp. LMS18]UTR09612.1 hypothetical protein MM300_17200 [Evansella sp. LMS18]